MRGPSLSSDRRRRPAPGPIGARRSIVARASVLVLAAVLGGLGLSMAWLAPSAGAQDGGVEPRSQVVAVDATADTTEIVLFTTDTGRPGQVTVAEQGEERPATLTTARDRQAATEVVFVVDTDSRAIGNGLLAEFGAALADELAALPDSVRVGLVRAGADAEVLVRPTLDRARPLEELSALGADDGSALLDAIDLATSSFSEQPGVVRTIVVVTGGADTASTATLPAVKTAVAQQGAQLITLSIGQAAPAFGQIISGSGGVALTLSELDEQDPVAAVSSAVATTTALATDRLVVSYPRLAEPGERPNVELTIDQQSISLSYPVGTVTTSQIQLAPTQIAAVVEPGLLAHPVVFYLSVGLAFVAIVAGVWVIVSIFAAGETSLDSVLARYADNDESLDEDEVQEMLVESALLRRAVAMTEDFAERQGFLSRLEEMLASANLPVRAGEAMFFLVGAVVVVFGLIAVVTGSMLAAAVLSIVAAGGGLVGLQLAARRRLKAFEAQLPDALQLLAGTLRAGHSLPQGLDAVSGEIADPMGYELRRAITEAQLGRDMEDALASIAERLDSPDFAWAVMAIGIQREVGGNLAEVLLSVAETMIQRDRLKREVSALTAEGRVSAFILSLMPPGLGFVMWVMNPEYVGVLFSRTIGLILVGAAVVSGLIGLFWMKKVITIDA